MQFSTLIGALTSNRIDVIAAAMYITEPRKQVIDFSDPIYTYGDGLFVPKADTKEYKSLEDLKGLTVGAQVGTAYVEPLQKSGLFPEVKIYDTLPDIMRDVNAGRAQGRLRRPADRRLQPAAGPLPRGPARQGLQADGRSARSASACARATRSC